MSDKWDDLLNHASVSDIERISARTEVNHKLRSYADNNLKGVYSCVRCAAPVYKSEDKFTPLESSVAEWPAFRAPISSEAIQLKSSFAFGVETTEIYCASCGLFMGTLFNDGKEVGDEHENAKERHSIHSFTVDFEKDASVNENPKPQQTPKQLLSLLIEEKLFSTSADEDINNVESKSSSSSSPLDDRKNKDVEAISILNMGDTRDDHQKSRSTNAAEKKVDSKQQATNNEVSGSNLVRNVIIGGALVGVAVGAYYYFTKKRDE